MHEGLEFVEVDLAVAVGVEAAEQGLGQTRRVFAEQVLALRLDGRLGNELELPLDVGHVEKRVHDGSEMDGGGVRQSEPQHVRRFVEFELDCFQILVELFVEQFTL